MEIPRIKSERKRITIGTEKATLLSEKFSPPNKAIAVTGEKFGGWGINLEIVAINISKKINLVFPNFKFQYNYEG